MRRIASALLMASLAGAAGAAPALTDEPLEPDRAFRPHARLVVGEPSAAKGSERHGIDIEYEIAPGYYLYRDRLRFEVWPPSLLIGSPEIAPGTLIDDPYFGKSAIFRERVTIHLPFAVSIAKPGKYRVKITAQGCADGRICYAPFPQEVVVNIPPGYRVTDMPAPRGNGCGRSEALASPGRSRSSGGSGGDLVCVWRTAIRLRRPCSRARWTRAPPPSWPPVSPIATAIRTPLRSSRERSWS